jgi:glycosyltransferase involved in cell wall biosynthesis
LSQRASISIVTICFNAVEHIEATIASVLIQGIPGLEYIIIDGGSTDGTIDVIRKYEKQLAAWVSEPDEGISDAFNKGIALASGELVGLLNAADYYVPGALKELLSIYKGSDVIYGNMRTLVEGKSNGDFHPDHQKLKSDMTLCHPATFIRKDAYLRYGDYRSDYRLAMDYELLLRFLLAGAAFEKIDLVLTEMSMDGVSNVHWKAALDEVHLAQKEQMGTNLARSLRAKLRTQRRLLAHRLERSGLGTLVTAYQKRFSSIKKEME